MFKSRTEHFHALLQSNNSFRSAPTNNTKSTNDPNSTSDLFQLDLFIEKLSLDASTLQNTTTPIEISPYLLIKVNGTTKAKTLAKRNNLKPQFNQNFLLSLENPKKDVISICVHDKESGGDLLAQCVLDDLDGYMYGKVTSLVVDLESGAGSSSSSSRASIASSSLFHEGCCGSLFVDVKPLNFGKSSPEQQQNANLSNNGKKKQTFDSKLQDEKKKTSASGSTTLTSSSSSSSEKATTSNNHTKNHNNNKPTNLNWDLVKSSTHGEITSQEESHHEMEGTNATTTEKRKSAWFSNNGLNSPSATPTHSESAFQFYDFQSGDDDDLAAAANSSCLIQMEGDKEFAKTKQQFKLLYIMAIDVQMFGERVRKLEELIEKWKLPENDTEKLRLKIQTTIQRAEKKRELLDQFLPKLSKKLPKVTNCKLTLMKLSKIKQQYSEIDQHYVQLVKLRQSLERKHRKKRMEQMMEFDELIDQVMFQPASDQIVSSIAAISSGIKLHNEDSTSARVGSYQKPPKENATSTQQKKRVANTDSSQQQPQPQPQTIVNTNSKSTKKNVSATTNDTTTTTPMVDRKTLRKQEQAKQKKQLFQAIEAGAMSSGANQPDHLIRKYEQHQKQIEQAKEQAQQKQIQFILSTADAETIEIEKKIANETKRELEVVERDFAELHEMYEQMNVMLRQQGEGLNIVEKNIQQANEYVKEGTEYVKAASAMTGTGILTGGFTKAAVLRKLLS